MDVVSRNSFCDFTHGSPLPRLLDCYSTAIPTVLLTRGDIPCTYATPGVLLKVSNTIISQQPYIIMVLIFAMVLVTCVSNPSYISAMFNDGPLLNDEPNQPLRWHPFLAQNSEQPDKIGVIGTAEDANITEVPYVVALVTAPGKVHEAITGGAPFCTGSIIHQKWVLTAAHCIVSQVAEFIKIIAGCDKRSDVQVTNAGGQVGCQGRLVSNMTKHPKFVEKNPAKFDVALIEPDVPFIFGPTVNKIDLWNSDWSVFPKPAPHKYGLTECQATGWGDVEIGTGAKTLRKANMSIKHGTQACICFQRFQQRRMLCGSKTDDLGGICPGDSGGPLVCNGTLAGVAHLIYHEEMCSYNLFGPKPHVSCNDPKTVGAWMYVCPMLSFIHSLVPNTPKQPASCRSPPIIRPSVLIAQAVVILGIIQQ